MNSWPAVTLGELARPKQWPTLSRVEMTASGFPVYGANGRIGYHDTFTHEKPTILIGCRGSCGTVHVTEPKSYANGNAMALDELDETRVNLGFLVQFFRRRGFRDVTSGTSQPQIIRQNIVRVEIPLPPLSEQRRIAEVLDRAEALRAKRRAALAQLDALTLSLFLDLFGDPRSNPKSWPEIAMSELFVAPPIFGSMIPPLAEKRGWLSLRVGNIQDWTLDLRDSKYVDLPPESVDRHSVRDGDLLMARAIASKDHLGKCVIAHPNGEQWAFDSHLMRLRFDSTRSEPEFIRHLFMTPGGRALFLSVSRKSTVQYNINTKEISSLRIPVPPISLQREFSRRITAVEKLKATHRAALAELDALFASLQHRAFRGEL